MLSVGLFEGHDDSADDTFAAEWLGDSGRTSTSRRKARLGVAGKRSVVDARRPGPSANEMFAISPGNHLSWRSRQLGAMSFERVLSSQSSLLTAHSYVDTNGFQNITAHHRAEADIWILERR
jgi:hypothetical protein